MSTVAVAPIRLGVMIGSESDLLQCEEGMKLIREAEMAGRVQLVVFIVNSIHRNTIETLRNLDCFTNIHCVQRWIIGAGMANHLTATCDAVLRYELKSIVPVFGCVFLTEKDTELNLETSIRSITQAPGNQVVFDPQQPFFADACALAIDMEEAVIEPRPPKETKLCYSTDEVLKTIDLIKDKKR